MVSDAGRRALSIFVCYRREDDAFLPGRLSDLLAGHFGEGNVFYDIDAIQPGFDFREVIRDRLAEVDAVLVLIGHKWDMARLGEPTDFVRTEIHEALRTNKLLIPVLVGSATMPSHDLFPPQLEPMAYLNAARCVADPDFDTDSARLITAIENGVAARRRRQPVLEPEPDPEPEPEPKAQPAPAPSPSKRRIREMEVEVPTIRGATRTNGGSVGDPSCWQGRRPPSSVRW